MSRDPPFAAVTFDCFGTLVDVDPPDDVGAAVADALAARGVDVPDDWHERYTGPHLDLAEGAELPLHEHVRAVLAARGRDLATAEAAVLAAFDREVSAREDADRAVRAAAADGPVGVLSNCTVPGLVERVLADVDLDGPLDAVVTSVYCGWRKPDARAFEAAADALAVAPAGLLHVGDDQEADGGVETVDGRYWPVDDRPLADLAAELEGDAWA